MLKSKISVLCNGPYVTNSFAELFKVNGLSVTIVRTSCVFSTTSERSIVIPYIRHLMMVETKFLS